MRRDLQVFTTCPPSDRNNPAAYRSQLGEIARWSEDAGCVGTLIYTDNRLYDPWLLAQIVIEQTERLSPLIAVQPVYMHPYTVAKLVATFGHLYSRRLWLNLVAGGFRNDLRALGDDTPHDRRYDRLVEFGLIVKRLLEDGGPTTFAGAYYNTRNLRLTPPLPPELAPGLTVAGSSRAGALAAHALDATAVTYPQAAAEFEPPPADRRGIRIGIIARGNEKEAWDAARRRFPSDRRGQISHSLAIAVTDSHWHEQLAAGEVDGQSPYWLHPFRNYQTFCPYLVGDYATVAAELARYLNHGITTLILDVPASPAELEHIAVALDVAERHAQA
jgi:alkanesulfonate monooxygenase